MRTHDALAVLFASTTEAAVTLNRRGAGFGIDSLSDLRSKAQLRSEEGFQDVLLATCYLRLEADFKPQASSSKRLLAHLKIAHPLALLRQLNQVNSP